MRETKTVRETKREKKRLRSTSREEGGIAIPGVWFQPDMVEGSVLLFRFF